MRLTLAISCLALPETLGELGLLALTLLLQMDLGDRCRNVPTCVCASGKSKSSVSVPETTELGPGTQALTVVEQLVALLLIEKEQRPGAVTRKQVIPGARDLDVGCPVASRDLGVLTLCQGRVLPPFPLCSVHGDFYLFLNLCVEGCWWESYKRKVPKESENLERGK